MNHTNGFSLIDNYQDCYEDYFEWVTKYKNAVEIVSTQTLTNWGCKLGSGKSLAIAVSPFAVRNSTFLQSHYENRNLINFSFLPMLP